MAFGFHCRSYKEFDFLHIQALPEFPTRRNKEQAEGHPLAKGLMTFLTILLSGVECAVVLREDKFRVVGQGSRRVKEVKSSSFAGRLAESACRAVKKEGIPMAVHGL